MTRTGWLRPTRGQPVRSLGHGLEIIYWMYSADGRLMRIGITRQGGGQRFGQYERDNEWFVHVADIHLEIVAMSRRDAEAYETEQIGRHRPPFNRIDNPSYEDQGQERAAICGHPVTVIDRARHARLQFDRFKDAAIRYGIVAAVVSATTTVAVAQIL